MTYGSAGVPPATGGATPARRRDDLGRSGVALLIVGSFFTLLSAVSLWSWRTFASSEGFADVATDTLKEPAVAEAVADQIVNILQDQVATAQAAVACARPAPGRGRGGLQRGLQGSVPRRRPGDARRVVQGHRRQLLVRVDDAKSLVKDALAIVNPERGQRHPGPGARRAPSASPRAGGPSCSCGEPTSPAGSSSPRRWPPCVCFTAAARRARDRRRALEVVGACLVAVGVVIFAVLAALLNVAADVGQDPRQRTALRAVFWSTMHVLNVTGKVLIVLGAVIALAASLAGGSSVRQRWGALDRMAQATLANPRNKAFAAFAAVVGGMVGLVWPAAVAELLVRVVGVGLIVVGAIWIFDLIGASAWVSEREQRRAGARVTPRRLALGGTTGVATFSLVLLLGGMSFVRAVRAPGLDRMSIKDTGCNGYRGALRSPARRGDLRRHPQRDVGQRRQLLLRPPDRRARRTARPGRPGLPARPPLRRADPGRRAHGLPLPGRQGGVRRGAGAVARSRQTQRPVLDRAPRPRRRRDRPEGPQGLPVPPVLRARRHAGARTRSPSSTSTSGSTATRW